MTEERFHGCRDCGNAYSLLYTDECPVCGLPATENPVRYRTKERIRGDQE